MQRTSTATLELRGFPGVCLAVIAALMAANGARAQTALTGYLRVNQVGYETGTTAHAYLLTSQSASGTTFNVRDDDGHNVFVGHVGPPVGSWGDFVVTPVTFSIERQGNYRLFVEGVSAPPAHFPVDGPDKLYAEPLHNALAFYQTERDGPDYIPGALRTAPAHLNDAQAMVYVTPPMTPYGKVIGELTPTGETIDASGGWWDAGDYLKFVQTTSYTVGVMLTGLRDFPRQMGPRSRADFTAEAKFGVNWLLKMWDDRTSTLHYQVALGSDFVGARTLSDHDLWRLPQVDDTLDEGNPRYALINHRPVFVSGPPGSPISPNLAGRLSADFALCFIEFHRTDPTLARRCLNSAEHIFDLADTNPTTLLTALPYGFYPETEWRDDLEWGASELYLALALGGDAAPADLPHNDAGYYLKAAANWAHAYITGPGDGYDTLNLYDVSGLAHYDLYRAIATSGEPTGLAVTRQNLLADLRQQLAIGADRAARDPFGFGGAWNEADSVAHGMGLAVTAEEIADLTGRRQPDNFAREWMGNILGANAWGVSMIIGDGSNPPHCPQHQVANLEGSLDGSGLLLRGAAVEGPNAPNAVARGFISGLRACPVDGVDGYKMFTSRDARFKDNVKNYANTEPAIDLTALSPLMFAWRIAGRPRPLASN